MDNQETEKRWRRFETLRSRKHVRRRLKKIESSTINHAHTFIFQRWQNVRLVRRQALAWLLLVSVLIASVILQLGLMRNAYQTAAPSDGGSYAEGVVGRIDSLNPILASTKAELAASRLLYSGLLTYDTKGYLKPDLAESWEISEAGKRYTIKLKSDLKWQDGTVLDASDVLFTYEAIKNPAVNSPYEKNWRNVGVSKVDAKTIQIDLPSPNGPFAHSLTTGIISQKTFKDIDPAEYRSSLIDKNPITNGPFHFTNYQSIDTETGRLAIHGVANPEYHLGRVNLDRFQLHVYEEREVLKKAFLSGEINAATDFTASNVAELNDLKTVTVNDTPLNSVAIAIFKSDGLILKDPEVRRALVYGTDRKKIIDDALLGFAKKLDQPLPAGILDQEEASVQAEYDFKKADELLTKQGWIKNQSGIREKDGQPLTLTVASSRSGDYPKVVETMNSQWSKLGIKTETVLTDPADVQQNIIAPRNYDVFVYELEVGADPDVYPYWHSSLAGSDQSLNLANLRSEKVDDALSSGRSRYEYDLRSAKYRTFIKEWLAEAPGVVLYQPTLHYVTNPRIHAIPKGAKLTDTIDRYNTLQYWSVGSSLVHETP